jgi:hypothetical protein
MTKNDQRLIWEAFATPKMIDKVVNMTSTLYTLDAEGYEDENPETYPDPGPKFDPKTIANDIKANGFKASQSIGHYHENDKVIYCQHNAFCTNPDLEDGTSIYVTFKKKLSEIFLDTEEFDFSEFGIPDDKLEAAYAKYDQLKEQAEAASNGASLKISLLNWADVINTTGSWLNAEYSWYGCFVLDIKPNEVTGVYVGPVCEPEKAKRF